MEIEGITDTLLLVLHDAWLPRCSLVVFIAFIFLLDASEWDSSSAGARRRSGNRALGRKEEGEMEQQR